MTFWDTVPLELLVIEALNKRDGIILENELLSLIEQETGDTPDTRELNKTLMNLEVNGKINVVPIRKSQRQIKLLSEGKNYLAIGED